MVGVSGSSPLVPTSFLLGNTMPIIELPDGSTREFTSAVTVAEVAQNIGAGLAKAAVAGKIDNAIVDTTHVISDDAKLSLITLRDEQGLDVLRHSCAHLMAQAVKSLFPHVQVTIGPVIEDGFYYDFHSEQAFTPEDLTAIEAKMTSLVKAALPIERQLMTRAEAIELFTSMGETFKVEIIQDLPEDETLSLYRQGDFIDLCRGPHVPNTGFLKIFKLTKCAGSYWRGDSNNATLQRIYGTAWGDKKSMQAYLTRLEEAKKRDHRVLAKRLDLFHFQEEAPGMVFWHPNGWDIVLTIREYLRKQLALEDYQEVNTPQLVDMTLWEKSGHKDKFGDDMFSMQMEHRDVVVKPMNCPCHVQIFKQGVTSYRDLPIRLAEFGCCHRNEPSGTLHGLMRLRGFVQDDAHIFCTEQQVESEVSAFIELLNRVYADFGFKDIIYKLSTRPEQRIGSDAVWDQAEQALAAALDSKGIDWGELPGEGAFYGPKIEFSLRDCLGRVWQCGTIQLDFSMPGRLGASYVDENGDKQVPVMIHRAVLGSLERFIAILIEQYAGSLPLWLAPKQVVIMNITDNHAEYSRQLYKKLKKNGIKVNLDLRNEKISYKIREHTLAKVSYQLIIGDREVKDQVLSVRDRSGETRVWQPDAWVEALLHEIEQKGE
jgi:threonyl-tRNA synthetase